LGAKKDRNTGTGFSVFFLCEKWGESQKNERGGWGKGTKEPLADKPWILKTSVRQQTELAIG